MTYSLRSFDSVAWAWLIFVSQFPCGPVSADKSFQGSRCRKVFFIVGEILVVLLLGSLYGKQTAYDGRIAASRSENLLGLRRTLT